MCHVEIDKNNTSYVKQQETVGYTISDKITGTIPGSLKYWPPINSQTQIIYPKNNEAVEHVM